MAIDDTNGAAGYTDKHINPRGGDPVKRIKDLADQLASEIEASCPPGQFRDRAVEDAVSASMFGVKALHNGK